MPNWTSSHLTLEGTAEALQQIFDIKFDFQKIRPCPFIHDANYDEGWYDWCVKYWGTKWCANEVELDYTVGDTTLTAMFETAWHTPFVLLTYLTTIHPSLKITNEWQDEGYKRVGITIYSNGLMYARAILPFDYTNETLKQFSKTNSWFCYDDFNNFIIDDDDEDDDEVDDEDKERNVVLIQYQYSYEEILNE